MILSLMDGEVMKDLGIVDNKLCVALEYKRELDLSSSRHQHTLLGLGRLPIVITVIIVIMVAKQTRRTTSKHIEKHDDLYSVLKVYQECAHIPTV